MCTECISLFFCKTKQTTERQQNQTFQLVQQNKSPQDRNDFCWPFFSLVFSGASKTNFLTTLQDQRRMGCKPNYAVCLLQHPERELCILGCLGSLSFSLDDLNVQHLQISSCTLRAENSSPKKLILCLKGSKGDRGKICLRGNRSKVTWPKTKKNTP